MKFPIRLTCLSALALSACATGGLAPNAVARLGDSPVVTGGSYTSGGGLSVAADIRSNAGKTLVCGVWAESAQQSALTALVESQVLGTASVFLGNERLLGNVNFMRKVDPAASYGGVEADCLQLDRPWRPGDDSRALSVRIPRQVVNVETDEIGGGFAVYFIPGGPGA